MTYSILDRNGEEVIIPDKFRGHLSPDLLIYQDLILGSRKYKIAAEKDSITIMFYKEIDPGIFKLISENEFTWDYWFTNYFIYVKIANWLNNNNYILVAN